MLGTSVRSGFMSDPPAELYIRASVVQWEHSLVNKAGCSNLREIELEIFFSLPYSWFLIVQLLN